MKENLQKQPLRLACPTIYNILTPPEVVDPIYKKPIDHWGWVNLIELGLACASASTIAYERFGPPTYPTPWAIAESFSTLIKDFGVLMNGNKEAFEKGTLYTYLMCDQVKPPKVDDCFIQSPKLPDHTICKSGNLFVPAGWSTEVIKLIRDGVQKIEVRSGGSISLQMLNGTLCSYRNAKY